MSPKTPRTKEVPKSMYANFLKRADECFNAARYSFDNNEWTASAISAIHSTIASCDAVCIYYLGKHSSGESHNDAVTVFKSTSNDEETANMANKIAKVLRIKNIAEYEQRLVFKSEAETIFKDCGRILEFAKKRLPL